LFKFEDPKTTAKFLERTHHDGEVEEGRRREERRKGRNTKRTREKTREIKR